MQQETGRPAVPVLQYLPSRPHHSPLNDAVGGLGYGTGDGVQTTTAALYFQALSQILRGGT
jgi:hypothetical protein